MLLYQSNSHSTMAVALCLLTWICNRPVELPYIMTGQILTIICFTYFLINFHEANAWDKLIKEWF